jgi:hypothetical protein
MTDTCFNTIVPPATMTNIISSVFAFLGRCDSRARERERVMDLLQITFIIQYNLHLNQFRQTAHFQKFCEPHLIVKMLIISILLFASQISVHACEGDCIVGITNAWVGNYTSCVHNVFSKLVRFRTTARSCPLMLRRPDKFQKSYSPPRTTMTR